MKLSRTLASLLACAVVAGVTLAGGSAFAAPKITQPFATLPPSSHPVAFSTDEGEALYTANSDGTVSRVTAAGVVTAAYASLGAGAQPCGMTTATDTNIVWVGDRGANEVAKVAYGGGVTKFALPGSVAPCALASNKAGDIFVADELTNVVSKISAAGVVTPAFATLASTAHPRALVVDKAGNVFSANSGDDTISKISPTGAVTAAFASVAPISGSATPVALAIDSAGTLFTANFTSRTVSKVTAAGVASVFSVLPEFTAPNGITATDGDWVTVSNGGTSTLTLIPPTGGRGSTVASVPTGDVVAGLVGTQRGIVYSADSTTNEIIRVGLRAEFSSAIPTDTLVTGRAYSFTFTATGIDPIGFSADASTLPPGLTLDPMTGILTGTPVKPGTYSFAVNAQNPLGFDGQRVTLTVLPGLRPPTHF
ncbi:Vgb family protein [Subtercola endophyticus]|uniref:Vgb family protein n=1 Tax=Subtercola endophyticus TaxID=2895559 RepID=UPI001E4EF739|nr:putative Ig domain-containing protein [Subtercola endophyticus]UFS60340.1 putative Ig domain-containing protein [Subtercola endophyticus]